MQEMPMEEQEQAAPQAGGGDPMEMVKQGGAALSKLAEMVQTLPSATDDDRAEAAGILDSYMGLVERLMSGGTKPEMGVAPADAGLKGVPVGPQGRV